MNTNFLVFVTIAKFAKNFKFHKIFSLTNKIIAGSKFIIVSKIKLVCQSS